jgi:hypothetical protein
MRRDAFDLDAELKLKPWLVVELHQLGRGGQRHAHLSAAEMLRIPGDEGALLSESRKSIGARTLF